MTTRTLASGTVVEIDESGRVVRPTTQARDFTREVLQDTHTHDVHTDPETGETFLVERPVWNDPYGDDERSGCDCDGSGLFYMGGAVVNGVYTGRTGTCFPCNGKGYQDASDRKRNFWYNAKYRRLY